MFFRAVRSAPRLAPLADLLPAMLSGEALNSGSRCVGVPCQASGALWRSSAAGSVRFIQHHSDHRPPGGEALQRHLADHRHPGGTLTPRHVQPENAEKQAFRPPVIFQGRQPLPRLPVKKTNAD